jgi:archaellum component FlaF (FlaF/FlaG flagellin family)
MGFRKMVTVAVLLAALLAGVGCAFVSTVLVIAVYEVIHSE